MRLSSRIELEFLRHTAGVLRGRYVGPGREALDPGRAGLTRLEGERPVRRALEDQVGKACLRHLAEEGGLRPERYVVGDRTREGALLGGVAGLDLGGLRFTGAVPDLLIRLHDRPLDDLGEPVPIPVTLGDVLAFHLVCVTLGNRTPAALLRASPLTSLERGLPGGAAPRVHDLPASPEGAWVLRARAHGLARRWCAGIRRTWERPPAVRGPLASALGTSLGAFCAGALEAERPELLLALLRLYRHLLVETRAPEDILQDAAEAAGTFRKVSDQEAFLRSQAALFEPAVRVEEEVARIHCAPFVEREEGEKILHDEVQEIGPEVLARASALHRALAGVLA